MRIALTFLCLLMLAGMTFAQTPTLQFGGRNMTTNQQDFVSSLTIQAGQRVQLQGRADVVTYCQSSWRPDRFGIVFADEVTPTVSTNYAVTCFGPNGNVSRTVQVTVGATPNFAVLNPVGGQTYAVGQQIIVSWPAYTGTTGYSVHYAPDGNNFTTLSAQILPASILTFSWTPTQATTTAKIRVIAYLPNNQAVVADTGLFTITTGSSTPQFMVAHSGTYQRGLISPGLVITIFGNELAQTTVAAPAANLPQTKLDGTQVLVADKFCYLFLVSPGQINCQVPDGVGPGTAVVQVLRDGRSRLEATVSVSDSFPGLFQDATSRAAITRANTYTWVGGSDIVNAGDYLTAWGTGFTPLSPAVPAGQPAPVSPPWSLVQARVELMINGVTYTDAVKFAGAGPGLVGVQQINFQIPAGLPKGVNRGTLLFNGQQVQPSFYFTTP